MFDFKIWKIAFIKNWNWSVGNHINDFSGTNKYHWRCVAKIENFAIFFHVKNRYLE